MKKLSPLLLILSFFLLTPAGVEAQESSLLWKVEADHLDEPSYLYGTMHLICSEFKDIPDAAAEAFRSADILALELDMSDPNMAGEMMMLGMNPDGKNIRSLMDDEGQKLLDAFFTQHYGVGLDQLGTMKPFMLSSMAMMPMISCDQEQASIDAYFLNAATERDIPVVGLETIAFQVGLFDNIPLQIQVDELVKMIENPQEGKDEFNQLSQLYASRDILAMYNLITEDEFWTTYKDVLLDSRNKAWIPVIKELTSEQSAFIAVGAGHLAGENGVINLLRANGFTVTAVE